MITRSYRTKLLRDGAMCAIPVPFDPKLVFGKVRAPVRVTVNGYTYRSTIAAMGGPPCIPLRKSHYEAAGIDGERAVAVRLELDEEERKVQPPSDLVKALKAVRGGGSGGRRSASRISVSTPRRLRTRRSPRREHDASSGQ